MIKVLFVCTGNTCRSSMAEGIFNHLAHGEDMRARSAGVYAYEGDFASSNSIKVLRDQWGMDISSHRSRMITANMVEEAGLVLTMTREHKRAVLSMFPEAAGKVFTLKEYAEGFENSGESDEYNFGLDITDPYGMSERAYGMCAGDIRAAVEKVIRRLKQ